MDQKTLARLEEFANGKQFYDALQFYRTKVTRTFRLKNNPAQTISLVFHAVEYFLKENQFQCAIDIANLLTESLLKNNTEVSDDYLEALADIAIKFCKSAEEQHDSENSEKESLLTSARRRLVENSIQWTKAHAKDQQESKFGSPKLHYLLAHRYLKNNMLELARNHYLLSDRMDEFGRFLNICWETFAGASEYDLLIVQAVLQLLCIDRYPNAQKLFDSYTSTSKKQYPFDSPLLNFAHILFDVIRKCDKSQFAVITEIYMPELMRDTNFKGYMAKIGKMYFGIRDQNSSGGGLAGLLSGLLGGEQKDESATSHLPFRDNEHKETADRKAPSKQCEVAAPTKTNTTMDVDDLD